MTRKKIKSTAKMPPQTFIVIGNRSPISYSMIEWCQRSNPYEQLIIILAQEQTQTDLDPLFVVKVDEDGDEESADLGDAKEERRVKV